jgi:hypothetical protein
MIAPSYQLMRETAYNNLSGLSILSDQSLGGAWADTTWVWLFQFLNEPYRSPRQRALSKARASPLNSWNLKAAGVFFHRAVSVDANLDPLGRISAVLPKSLVGRGPFGSFGSQD